MLALLVVPFVAVVSSLLVGRCILVVVVDMGLYILVMLVDMGS